jgi:hypothetical protein
VADELAFPLLLRGLSASPSWESLQRAEPRNISLAVTHPQDFLLFDDVLDERGQELHRLEAAHYIHPLDTGDVLRNHALRDVICRNL